MFSEKFSINNTKPTPWS